jgi:clan AA aspartic protease (TIGR02281 family)
MKRPGRPLAALLLPIVVTLGLTSVLAETVPLKEDHGTFVVPVVVNDRITLDFTIDSGASDVVIPADVFSTLTRTGTITANDYRKLQEYQLADGSTGRSQTVRIRSLQVGSVEVRDVIASVAPQAGTLLLGQSFLSRLPSWSVDNQRHVLVINQSSVDAPIVPLPAQTAQVQTPRGQGPNWVQIDKFADMTVYVDLASIRATADSMRSAWVKNVMMPHKFRGVLPSDVKKWMTFTVHRDTADCGREMLRTDASTFYFEDGSLSSVPAAALPTDWQLVPPDTASASELQAMCRASTDGTNRN